MYTWLARIGLQLVADPEKALKIGLLLIAIPILLVALLFAVPISFFKHMPLGSSQDEFDYYMQGATQIQTETGITVSWQYIMAVDAVILNQNFKESSAERAYGYKDYFVREEQVKIEKTCTDDKGESYDCSYYETQYFARDFEETIQMLIDNGLIQPDQAQDVRDKVEYVFDVAEGKVSFVGGSSSGETTDGGDVVFQPVDGEIGWPTEKNITRITSPFGYRTHPISGKKKLHKGTDLAAPIGTPVYSVRDGVVTKAGWGSGGAGNMVRIDHGDGMVSVYMHLDSFKVKSGATVKAGQLIALSGNTGGSTGPHLHYQIEINGEPVDAMQFYK